MNHLSKIITINSYNANKINQFEVEGGCLVQGTNGAGKTSLLRLSLLFFGTQPDGIAKIAGKGNRFADYYLKTPSSYVAFEYIKEGKSLLVIVYSKAGGELTYQFFEGAFEERLFLDMNGRFVPCDEIKSHIQAVAQRKLSSQFTWGQYREIIQSAIRKAGGSADNKTINEAKLRYSLCEQNKSIQNTDKVAISILSSKPSLQSVRELIAHEIIGMDNLISTSSVNKEFNPEIIIRQRKLLRQAKGFKDKQALLVEMQSLDGLLIDLESELMDLKALCIYSHDEQQERSEQTRKEVVELLDSITILKGEYESESGKLNSDIGQKQAELKSLNVSISQLDSQYQQYQNQDIEGKKLLAQELDLLQGQSEGVVETLKKLEDDYKNIVQIYENELHKLRLAFQKKKEQARDLHDEKVTELRIGKESLDKEESKEKEMVDDQFSSLTEKQQETRGSLLASESRIRTERKNPTNDELVRLRKEVDQISESISAKQFESNVALRAASEKKDEQADLTGTRDSKLRLFETLKSEKSKLEAKKIEHQNSLKNLERILYFKMKSIAPDRADLALRALNPELLKKPFNDELIFDPQGFGLLGFDVDFSEIPALQILEQDELEVELASLEQAIDASKQQQAELSASIEAMNAEIPKLVAISQEASLKVKKLDEQIIELQRDFKAVKGRLDVELNKFTHELEDAIKHVIERIKAVDNEIKESKAAKSEKLKSINELYQEKRNELLSDEIQALERYQREVASHDEVLKSEEDKIDELKQKDLSDAGAQADEIRDLRLKIGELNNRLDLAKAALKEVDKYTYWLENKYVQRDSMLHEQRSLSEDFGKLKSDLEGISSVYEQRRSDLQASLEHGQKALTLAEQQVAALSGLLMFQFADIPTKQSSSTIQVIPAYELKNKVLTRLDKRKAYSRNGYDNCYKILQSLKQTKELEDTVQGALASEGLEDLSSANQWRKHIKAIEYLIGDYLTSLIDGIHQEYRVLAQRLIDLDTNLDDTAKRIKDKGREISRKMNEAGTSFSKIEAIEANITSNIDQIGFRRSLRDAAKEAEQVKVLPVHEEPQDRYFELVSSAISDIERYGKNLQLEQFIEIEISVKNKGVSGIRTAKNDKELHNIDSEGLSFLILLSLYMAIKNTFQKSREVKLLWPIDELGKLHHENVEALMEILKREQVDFLCAEPSTNPKVLSLFKHIYEIKANARVVKTDSSQSGAPVQAFLNAAQFVGEATL